MRLFSAYVAYDWHPCGYEKGCGPDCPDGTYRYTPTVTGIVGKIKPMIAFEEYIGSANEQFVEYGMTNWFFDADDDNLLMAAGTQIKALDDRLYVQALITNGNESQFPNAEMDDYPGINIGGWYDFGGTWNEARKRYDLFGDTISDIDYSCNPVLRVGGAANLVPMDSRSEYSNAELSRIRVTSPGVGGTTLLSELNGTSSTNLATNTTGSATTPSTPPTRTPTRPTGPRSTTASASTTAGGSRTSTTSAAATAPPAPPSRAMAPNCRSSTPTPPWTAGRTLLFPHHALIAYGSQLQGGYFVVPKKLELCARVSWIRGDSGNIQGNGTFTTLTAAQVDGPRPAGRAPRCRRPTTPSASINRPTSTPSASTTSSTANW